jgi:repressor LexA
VTAAVAPLLSPTQVRVLNVIRDYYRANGYAPSLRDIAAATGLAVSGVQYQVGQLQAKGWIRRHPNRPRTLVVLNPADGSDT